MEFETIIPRKVDNADWVTRDRLVAAHNKRYYGFASWVECIECNFWGFLTFKPGTLISDYPCLYCGKKTLKAQVLSHLPDIGYMGY